jgi:hypothetical protein
MKLFFLLYLLIGPFCSAGVTASPFPIGKKGLQLWVIYQSGQKTDSIVANLLATDIAKVTGKAPGIATDPARTKGAVILIGKYDSELIKKYAQLIPGMTKNIAGKWETFGLRHLQFPGKPISEIFIIAGSDTRGTAYGAFYVSEKVGVSPWYWWADVTPRKQATINLPIEEYYSAPPSVKYRGIFINDEDWGLQPWAANTFEPETGNIGPKTYAKVFELLLRLRANLLWPAMHPGTAPFFSLPENQQMAADYSIVIGSSHAEPMLRNNVGEWNEKTMGSFNYLTNKDRVQQYWKGRIEQSQENEVIFSMGMRGVHDSGIEGVKTTAEAVPLVEKILADQRAMLQAELKKPASIVPQAFTAYKEVLEIYDKNLQLPDDITLVWPDDNYGYIQRLSSKAERSRSGGAGVYYHASYWGRPHDYLWLSSTNPALIREEMMKAYTMGADKLWVLNVGDIKPLEYNIQLFLDMAYQAKPFEKPGELTLHIRRWCENLFGSQTGNPAAELLARYYQLAFERRPEFMGWSQTEPTTPTKTTGYNHEAFGDEAARRISEYDRLERQINDLRKSVPDSLDAAFYQLFYYPVVCASLMNKKFLNLDKAIIYAEQNRLSAGDYFQLSKRAYDEIIKETTYFNDSLRQGKWKNMMSMKPRALPVFAAPRLPAAENTGAGKTWNIAPEKISADKDFPDFAYPFTKSCFVDLFLETKKTLTWKATASEPWIKLSQSSGMLDTSFGKKETRVWVQIDKSRLPDADSVSGLVTFTADGESRTVKINALAAINDYTGFVENNNYVNIPAGSFARSHSSPNAYWSRLPGFGSKRPSLQSLPPDNFKADSAYVEYDFFLRKDADPRVTIYSLPTFPLNSGHGMRYALSIDGGKPVIVDFKTVGRTEEWKQNVLRNAAEKSVKFEGVAAGPHKLRLHVVDPGVVIDRILITTADIEKAYSEIPD